jgi:hypothetical protein
MDGQETVVMRTAGQTASAVELRRAREGNVRHELEIQWHHGPPHLLAHLRETFTTTKRRRSGESAAAVEH